MSCPELSRRSTATSFWNRLATKGVRPGILLALGLALTPLPGISGDWPQLLGPNRNGEAGAGPMLAATWPKEGPRQVWKRPVGEGYAGPVVAEGRLILFHRSGNKESIECLDVRTGKPIWNYDYATGFHDDFGFDDGPRGTPTIHSNRVYTFGAEGAVHCLDFQSGKKVWQVDAKAQFGAQKGYFGLACSPLVEGPAVILQVGGRDGAGIVALHRDTGAFLWKATDHEAGYSSPLAATLHGKRYVLAFTRNGLVAADPASGRISFDFPWRSRMSASVNASVPLILGDTVFISAGYNTGATLLRWGENGPEKIWSGDDILSTHYMTAVHQAGMLYGVDGRADPGFRPAPELRCIDAASGKIRWSKEGLGAGTLTLIQNQLLFLTDRGELILLLATPESYQEKARAQVLPSDVRAHPALAQGFFYARSKRELVALDLRDQP